MATTTSTSVPGAQASKLAELGLDRLVELANAAAEAHDTGLLLQDEETILCFREWVVELNKAIEEASRRQRIGKGC